MKDILATATDAAIAAPRLSEATEQITVYDPATLEVVESLSTTTISGLESSITVAAQAQLDWQSLSLARRGEAMRRLAQSLEDNAAHLSSLLTQEQGKPLAEATAEVNVGIQALRYFSQADLSDEVLKTELHQYVIRRFEPIGVVGLLTAWNFPVALLCWKLASALIAGNAAIIKPAPTTPLTARYIHHLLEKILPPGLVAVVIGDAALGDAMVRHPNIGKISFTGSTPTGRKIMAAASERLKPLTLELGGNDAAIILPDADIDRAVSGIANVAFRNSGQVCIAPKRILVPKNLYRQVRDKFIDYLSEQSLGNGYDPSTTMGPVHNLQQASYLKDLLEETKAQGGQIYQPASLPDLPGHFINPAIVTDVTPNARLVREEQFGPVLPLLPYTNVEQAIELANATQFGLGGSVWGQDENLAFTTVSKLQTGTCWVNSHGPAELDIPFGGVKQSGLGVELSIEGVKSFCQTKIINQRKL